MTLTTTFTLLNIGFSIIVAPLLLICYLFFLKSSNKSLPAMIFSFTFLASLTLLQFEHLSFITESTEPLNSVYYRALLFIVPSMFYFFSRHILFAEYRLTLLSAVHLLPFFSVFYLDKAIAIPVAFTIGTGYCLWLTQLIYKLRTFRKRFEIEFFFIAFFSLFAIAVLIFGFSVSYIDSAYFYYFYANGIGLAFVLVTAALIIYPDLLNELTEAVKLGYSQSTLGNINIQSIVEKLEQLMLTSKIYQNENLNLALLAESMQLTNHQLSELINSHFGVSFSKYIRQQRVDAAKRLLSNEPNSSILAISMETGFKSQSNFYAAFKEITGQSPGSYRRHKDM